MWVKGKWEVDVSVSKPFQAIIIVVWKPSENPYNAVAHFFLAACCCLLCCFGFLRCAWSWCLTKIIRGEPGLFFVLEKKSGVVIVLCLTCSKVIFHWVHFKMIPIQIVSHSMPRLLFWLSVYPLRIYVQVRVLVRSVLLLLVHYLKWRCTTTQSPNTKYS